MRTWLKEIRGERSQKDFALMLGVAQGFYSDLEGGRKTPSPKQAKKIASVLGFEWTRFYEEEE